MKIFEWTLILILLAGQTLRAEPYAFTEFGPRLQNDYEIDLSNFFPEDAVGLQELGKLAQESSGYEDFLDTLQKRRPQFFENYVLIHDSGSIQYADRQHPRVLLFSDGLILAFAEDPATTVRTVEILALNPQTFEFQMQEIRFLGEKALYTENPANCQSCHGKPAKPLWEPYDFWPNIYGSSIARFGTVDEKQAYENLRHDPNKKGIYRLLQWYAPPANNNRGMDAVEAFTQYVTQMQLMAVLKNWFKTYPDIARYVPLMLAIGQSCTNAGINDDSGSRQLFLTYLPEQWRAALDKNLAATFEKAKQDRRNFKTYQVKRYQQFFPGSPQLFRMDHERLASELTPFSQLRFVFNMLGLDMADLAMSQGPNPFLFSVPSNAESDLSSDLALVQKDFFVAQKPDLHDPSNYRYNWPDFSCDKLQQESRRRLASLPLPTLKRSNRLAPTVMGECIQCHVLHGGEGSIPKIPFDSSASLRAFLTAGDQQGFRQIIDRISRTGAGHMPPQRVLSEEERRQLKANLEILMTKP